MTCCYNLCINQCLPNSIAVINIIHINWPILWNSEWTIIVLDTSSSWYLLLSVISNTFLDFWSRSKTNVIKWGV